jgi:hypothetical protein
LELSPEELDHQAIDFATLCRKYAEERATRLCPDALEQYQSLGGKFANFLVLRELAWENGFCPCAWLGVQPRPR